MKKRRTNWDDGFDCGFACACAVMMKEHDQPTMVEDCLKANMMQVEDMKRAGVPDNDIEILRPVINEINRKNKL